MKINIDNKEYIILIKENFLDKDNEFKEEIIPLEMWVEILSKKAISTLFYLEEILTEETGKQIYLSKDYPHVKKPILNFSGSVSRLPQNLIIKPLLGGDE